MQSKKEEKQTMDYINHVTEILEQLDLFQLKLEYLEEMCYNERTL